MSTAASQPLRHGGLSVNPAARRELLTPCCGLMSSNVIRVPNRGAPRFLDHDNGAPRFPEGKPPQAAQRHLSVIRRGAWRAAGVLQSLVYPRCSISVTMAPPTMMVRVRSPLAYRRCTICIWGMSCSSSSP
jgi:hypothetical protein